MTIAFINMSLRHVCSIVCILSVQVSTFAHCIIDTSPYVWHQTIYRVSQKNLTPFIFKLASNLLLEFDNSHVYSVYKKKAGL